MGIRKLVRDIPTWNESRFDLTLDTSLWTTLAEELKAHGGPEWAGEHWNKIETSGEPSFERLLPEFCGVVQASPLAIYRDVEDRFRTRIIDRYMKFFQYGGIFDAIDFELRRLSAAYWRILDLGSLLDLFILLSARERRNLDGLTILEIGGGFGRLYEFMSKSGYKKIKYINIDAIPSSLTCCSQYLRMNLPDKTVRIFGTEESNANAEVDAWIVPAWRMKDFSCPDVQLAMNIESFQEMNPPLVERYCEYVDAHLEGSGIFYSHNSRSYINKIIPFPEHWILQAKFRSPRAWSPDHPAELFMKRPFKSDIRAALLEASYKYSFSEFC